MGKENSLDTTNTQTKTLMAIQEGVIIMEKTYFWEKTISRRLKISRFIKFWKPIYAILAKENKETLLQLFHLNANRHLIQDSDGKRQHENHKEMISTIDQPLLTMLLFKILLLVDVWYW